MTNKLRVLHLTTSAFDGAGIAASRICQSLAGNDQLEVRLMHQQVFSEGQQWASSFLTRLWQKIRAKIHFKLFTARALAVKPGFDIVSNPLLDHPTSFHQLPWKPDILHLHWISHLIDYPSFFASLPKDIPVFWTIHDMNPLTGGCHYAWDCTKFETTCHHCPQLPPQKWFDLVRLNFKVKAESLKNLNLIVLPNSSWTHKMVKASSLLSKYPCEQMNLPIDVQAFSPMDKKEARRQLQLPESDAIYLCFGAIYLQNKRKGLRELTQALALLKEMKLNIKCLVFGSKAPEEQTEGLPEFVHFGKIRDIAKQRLLYAATDVFVIPSLQETFGQTCLEAMACGTAVVGFDGSGVSDMIEHGKTGLMAKQGDYKDLAAKIAAVCQQPELRLLLAEEARKKVEHSYAMHPLGEQYAQLYLRHSNIKK